MVTNKEAFILWLIMLGNGACCLYMMIMTVRLTLAFFKLHAKQMAALAAFYFFLTGDFFILVIITSPFYQVVTRGLELDHPVSFAEVNPILYIRLVILIGIFISGFIVDYYMRAEENG